MYVKFFFVIDIETFYEIIVQGYTRSVDKLNYFIPEVVVKLITLFYYQRNRLILWSFTRDKGEEMQLLSLENNSSYSFNNNLMSKLQTRMYTANCIKSNIFLPQTILNQLSNDKTISSSIPYTIIIRCGGINSNDYSLATPLKQCDMIIFDTNENNKEKIINPKIINLPNLPESSTNGSCIYNPSTTDIIYGGGTHTEIYSLSLDITKPNSWKWQQIGDLNLERESTSLCWMNNQYNKLMISGGYATDKAIVYPDKAIIH